MGRARRRALAALLLSISGVVACTDDGDGGENRSSGSGSDSGGGEIAFDMAGGDSYSWTEKVIGHSDCGDVAIEVNGEPVQADLELNGSSFVAKVPVSTGANEIVAACGDGFATTEPLVFRQRLLERPTARIEIAVRGRTVILNARASEPAMPNDVRLTNYSWAPGGLRVGLRTQGELRLAGGRVFDGAEGKSLRLKAPTQSGEYFVTLEVTDADGLTDATATYFVAEEGTARAVDMMNEHPEWIDDAVIYAPIPALWGNGGPKSVERKLPYLNKLGVDALWLWPPTSLRTSGEEYAIEDYFDVDPEWGPEGQLKDMIAEAHRLGMYVLVDFVPNHMSSDSPYFQEAESGGRLSTYWRFFDRRGGEYTHYFDWDNLPNLNFDNPEVRNMIMESTSHWVRDIGVDGFRMDVAWGVKRRRPDFWPEWRREIKRINPDVLLLAEASAVDPYYFSHGFDVAYDWTRELGQWAWASAFEFPEEAGALLRDAITNGGKGYASDAQILRFLNNNDTGIRFIDQHGPKLTKVAATMQFTLPGTPAMFAGDEIGASYEPYSNLTPIRWRDQHGLRPHYERLIHLKHTVPALNSDRVELLEVGASSAVAYVRPPVESGSGVLVIENYGSKARVRLSGPALDSVVGSDATLMRDLITGKTIKVSLGAESVSLTVPAETSFILGARGN